MFSCCSCHITSLWWAVCPSFLTPQNYHSIRLLRSETDLISLLILFSLLLFFFFGRPSSKSLKLRRFKSDHSESVWNDVMAAILKLWCHIRTPKPSVDGSMGIDLNSNSCQISSRSDLKRRGLRLFLKTVAPTRTRRTTTKRRTARSKKFRMSLTATNWASANCPWILRRHLTAWPKSCPRLTNKPCGQNFANNDNMQQWACGEPWRIR